MIESAQELFSPLNPTINFAIGDDFISKKKIVRPFIDSRVDDFEKLLSLKKNSFFFGKNPRGCDFGVYHHISLARILYSALLAERHNLQKFMKDIETLPKVTDYLSNRPELVGIGVNPQLTINGKSHPTGIIKT